MSIAPDLSDFSKEEIKETLDPIRHPVKVAIFGSDNYFNVGAIIRTCHVFLVDEVILVDIPKFYEKAAMGTHKWENITHMTLEEFCRQHSVYSSSGGPTVLVGFERRPDMRTEELFRFKFPRNPILCFGSEKTGLPDEVIELIRGYESSELGGLVSIPQYGLQNDMNLSNAVSIAIYDWLAKHYR